MRFYKLKKHQDKMFSRTSARPGPIGPSSCLRKLPPCPQTEHLTPCHNASDDVQSTCPSPWAGIGEHFMPRVLQKSDESTPTRPPSTNSAHPPTPEMLKLSNSQKNKMKPTNPMPTRMLTNRDNTYLSHFQQTHL